MVAWTLIVIVATGLAVFGLVRGTWAVGGSDSSCYGLMTLALARGAVQPVEPLALEAPWPDAARAFAPGGFVPSPVSAGAASPVCAPGFALLAAPLAALAGRDALFVVTPVAGGVAVVLAAVIATALASPWAGATVALLVATIPVLLFQVVQPMNDVTVTALWLLVIAAALLPEPSRAWAIGAATGVAVLVRPNLAPAALIALGAVLFDGGRPGNPAALRRRLLGCALAGAPSLVWLLALNTILYGGPFASGYGAASELFSASYIWPNLTTYGQTILATEFGLPFVGFIALVVATRRRSIAWLSAGVSAAIVSVYLIYRPFPEWWYVRFLLPALVPLTVLAVAVCDRQLAQRVSAPARVALLVVLGVGGAAYQWSAASARQAFDITRLERRFLTTGTIVREQLPANAVVVTVWHSGTVRFHADRTPLLWDGLPPEDLDAALAWLDARGRRSYILVEDWEEPLFRERFDGRSTFGGLDWPPRWQIDGRVRIFDPRDREAYLAGGAVMTQNIRTP